MTTSKSSDTPHSASNEDCAKSPSPTGAAEWLDKNVGDLILIAGRKWDGFKAMLWNPTRWITLPELLSLYAEHIVAPIRQERDEALALNHRVCCSYCGKIDMRKDFSPEELKATMLAHLAECPTHPVNLLVSAEREVAQLRLDKEQLCGDVRACQKDYDKEHKLTAKLRKELGELK